MMKDELTIAELEKRWDDTLSATQIAVSRHPGVYREIKALAGNIIGSPLDINEYFPTVQKLADLLETMDPGRRGSIFSLFNSRITPSTAWQVSLFRVECKDMLAHLAEFDTWRKRTRRLQVIK
jgi:hypothetical protein